MSIPETIILALIAAVASVVAAAAGRGYTSRSKQLEAETSRLAAEHERETSRLTAERERETSRLATDEVRWTRLEADVARLTAEVAALRQENEALRREYAAERAAREDAEDTLRDHEELIEDLLVYLIVRQDWEDSGSTPPPPVLSWRILAALRKRRAAMTGPIPTAHDQTTTPPTSQED